MYLSSDALPFLYRSVKDFPSSGYTQGVVRGTDDITVCTPVQCAHCLHDCPWQSVLVSHRLSSGCWKFCKDQPQWEWMSPGSGLPSQGMSLVLLPLKASWFPLHAPIVGNHLSVPLFSLQHSNYFCFSFLLNLLPQTAALPVPSPFRAAWIHPRFINRFLQRGKKSKENPQLHPQHMLLLSSGL